ncbi:hypothetical protein NKJ36_05460 [Mesorhizobium sp. M0142]|uniref:hypothetical protein n=1 Tax=unclassified Mesorhizobium TaxID=325217 RepID=UPI00333C770B
MKIAADCWRRQMADAIAIAIAIKTWIDGTCGRHQVYRRLLVRFAARKHTEARLGRGLVMSSRIPT